MKINSRLTAVIVRLCTLCGALILRVTRPCAALALPGEGVISTKLSRVVLGVWTGIGVGDM